MMPVERLPVDDQVAQHGESPCPPWLDEDLIAVGELAHVELARGRALLPSVGLPVAHHPAAAADALAAVVLEGDRFLASGDESLVDDVEHLEEGHVGTDSLGLLGVGDHPARMVGPGLAPDMQGQVHVEVLPNYLYDRWVSLTYSNSSGSRCNDGVLPLPAHAQAPT
jgi:hypothetical protein